MKQIAVHGFVVTALVYTLLFASGCTEPSDKAAAVKVEPQKTVETEVRIEEPGRPAELALKFVPADSTTYKVALEAGKSVKWEGQTPSPKGFKGGHTSNKMEMTFSQQIESVEDQGNAVAKITIKELKYVTTVKNNVVLDFDSSRENDHGHALNNLIGQSYKIEITPSGRVLEVIGTSDALAAAAGDKTAVALLSADAIKRRHAVPALPAPGENQLRAGENWSNIKNVSFDMMGSKSFERVYTLKEVQDAGNRRIAVAEMEAVPSVENVRDLRKEQTTDFFSQMFDNTEDYTGELKLDLTEGKIARYREELVVEWLIVNPNPKKDEPPAALKMGAARLFSIEKID